MTFEPATWSDRVAGDLTMIADVKARDLAIFKTLVEAGEFHLLEIAHKGQRVGSLIWSIDMEQDGFSIVINAAAARPVEGVCIAGEMHSRFLALAQTIGARTIRCWTQRAGLVRKLENLGATRRYVMEVEL